MENIDTIDFILYTALAFVCAYILFKVWGSKTFEKICDITLDCLGFIYFVITLGNYPYDTRKVKTFNKYIKGEVYNGLRAPITSGRTEPCSNKTKDYGRG